MYKQIIALTLVAFAAVSYSQIVGIPDCGSRATIRNVFAGDCVTPPCRFERGQTYNIELHATATDTAHSLPYNVTANILGLPWTIMEGNACDMSDINCPTTTGDQIYFVYSYTVSEIFPPVPTNVTTIVRDHNDDQVICFILPIQIA